MTASAHHPTSGEPPRERRIGRIGFRTTEEESLLIRKAAELQGWTVTQYVLCAILDRAERDLYEHAARLDHRDQITRRTAEPFGSLACVFGR